MKAKLYIQVILKDSYVEKEFSREIEIPLAFPNLVLDFGNWEGVVATVGFAVAEQNHKSRS